MIVPVTAAQAQTTGRTAPAQVGRDEGGEYVVAYDTAKAEQAMNAIAAAGGTVEDVQSQIGLALVQADAGFAEQVTKDASVTGAMIDESVGATEQGRATVRAAQRLTAVDEAQHGRSATKGKGKGKGKDKGGLEGGRPVRGAAVGHADDRCDA